MTRSPRHDFYQTDSHLIVAVYLKGYAQAHVDVKFEPYSVTINLPELGDVAGAQHKFEPLYAMIRPEDSSFRALSTKIELKLAKAVPANWTSVTSSSPAPSGSSYAQASSKPAITQKHNWDKLVETELEDKSDSADPNAGGDAALQKMFAQIYAGADEDTKRAMIKSFTESGGTTLSTDWSSIGRERTPVRPPDGMVERKF